MDDAEGEAAHDDDAEVGEAARDDAEAEEADGPAAGSRTHAL